MQNMFTIIPLNAAMWPQKINELDMLSQLDIKKTAMIGNLQFATKKKHETSPKYPKIMLFS